MHLLNNNVVKQMHKAQTLSATRMQHINVNAVKVYTIVYKYNAAYCKRNNLTAQQAKQIKKQLHSVQTKACTYAQALDAFNNSLNSLNSFKLFSIY
jgi:hypothetical protein